MSLVENQLSNDSHVEALRDIRRKGVQLWAKNGELHYRAPRGALTQRDFECLRTFRGQIIALLERECDAGTLDRPLIYHAPLSFSQLAHWHLYRLNERPAIRQVAYAMHILGRFNIEALSRSLEEVVRRHDALRTRIVLWDGVPVQEIANTKEPSLEVKDLTSISARSREGAVMRHIEGLVLEPINAAIDPLFAVRILKLGDSEYVLIVALEHMISDGYSVGVLVRELFAAYAQAVKGQAFSWSSIPMQSAEYAVWQRNVQQSQLEQRGALWKERARRFPIVKFPDDQRASETNLGWGTVSFRIGRDLKSGLRRWCRINRTTLVMSVFAAYAGLVLRWCNASEAMIQYVTDGRTSPRMEGAIGFYASILYLQVVLRDRDRFVDLLNQLTEEYCTAHENADSCYLMAQLPRPRFTRNPAFNWLPQASFKVELSDLDGSADAIICTPIHFSNPMAGTLSLDDEPFLLLNDAEDEIVCDLYFSRNRFSVKCMERFARNFLFFIEMMLRRPEVRVTDITFVE